MAQMGEWFGEVHCKSTQTGANRVLFWGVVNIENIWVSYNPGLS
jgi:hypothetical protein